MLGHGSKKRKKGFRMASNSNLNNKFPEKESSIYTLAATTCTLINLAITTFLFQSGPCRPIPSIILELVEKISLTVFIPTVIFIFGVYFAIQSIRRRGSTYWNALIIIINLYTTFLLLPLVPQICQYTL